MFFVNLPDFAQFGSESRQEAVSAKLRKTAEIQLNLVSFPLKPGIGSFGRE